MKKGTVIILTNLLYNWFKNNPEIRIATKDLIKIEEFKPYASSAIRLSCRYLREDNKLIYEKGLKTYYYTFNSTPLLES